MKDYINQATGAERRFITGKPVEIRADEGKPKKFTGYAALYNSRSANLGSEKRPFIEVINPGAFDGVLNDDVRALFNHNPDFVLGRSKNGAGTVKLFTDERGLGFEIDVPDTQLGRDLAQSVSRGDVDQNSFAFTVASDGDKWEERDGAVFRTINKISALFDISIVTYPAYPDTSVAVRNLDQFFSDKENQPDHDRERRLRVLNLSS